MMKKMDLCSLKTILNTPIISYDAFSLWWDDLLAAAPVNVTQKQAKTNDSANSLHVVVITCALSVVNVVPGTDIVIGMDHSCHHLQWRKLVERDFNKKEEAPTTRLSIMERCRIGLHLLCWRQLTNPSATRIANKRATEKARPTSSPWRRERERESQTSTRGIQKYQGTYISTEYLQLGLFTDCQEFKAYNNKNKRLTITKD